MILTCLAIAACASKPPPPPSPPTEPAYKAIYPACNLEGCCAGHGEVAYLQPDRFVMCTDGEPSRICDCH